MGFVFILLIVIVVSFFILRSICLNTAVGQFIEAIRENRSYDDGSRKACIAVFKLLSEEHEVTKRPRRDFSSALHSLCLFARIDIEYSVLYVSVWGFQSLAEFSPAERWMLW